MIPAMSLMAFAPGPSLLGYTMLVGQQLVADPIGTVSIVAFGTVIAAGSPEQIRGRIESTISVLATIGLAAGYAIGGFLGESRASAPRPHCSSDPSSPRQRRCASVDVRCAAFIRSTTSRLRHWPRVSCRR